MVFMNSSGPIPAPDFAFPDVCLTPVVVPVPIPYPNFAMAPMAVPSQFTVLTMCMPAHNMLTTKPISLGDNAGVNMGVASGMVMGPQRPILGSTGIFVGGPPCTRMLGMGAQNGMSPNIPGITIAPSQVKVMVLR